MKSAETVTLDDTDRAIINGYQGGFPLTDEPYEEMARDLGIGAEEALGRVERLLEQGVLSRFGPMYHAEKMGGGLTLAALHAPDETFEQVAEIVNGFPQVAHNYARDHHLNMWFVVATETPEGVAETLSAIEAATGLAVYDMPKQEEFFIGLRFEA